MANEHQKFLKIPAAWLRACGYGEKDTVFPVIRTYKKRGHTVADVRLEDGREWTVMAEMNGAVFVDS